MARDTKGFFIGALKSTPLFYDPFARGHGHMLTYAPSRTGKTVCAVIPALLHWFGGSVFVTDVKGELTATTSRLRRLRGQRVLILNPFNVPGFKSVRFNPLRPLFDDVLHHQGKNLGELARLIASQLIPEPSQPYGDGRFFRGGGRRLLTAMMLYLAVFEPANCHFPFLRKLIWSTSDEKRVIAAKMQSTTWFGGLLRDYGNMLADMLEPQYIKTFGAFRDNAVDALEIYDAHTDFGRSVMESDFALSDMLNGKTTLYVILPESKIQTHGAWMGLITTLLIETISGAPKPSPILMLLEEMGNLGRIPNLAKLLSLLPGRGVRSWMIFQSRRQPVEIYGPQTAGVIEEQSSLIQSWSIRSEEDRKAWSARIGTTTRKARSLSRDPHDTQAPWRLSVNERAAPVLPPDEIARLGTSQQLIAIDGQPVILGTKVPYFANDTWQRKAGEPQANSQTREANANNPRAEGA